MPPTLQNSWQRTLATLAVVLGCALLAGLALGQPWAALAIAAITLLVVWTIVELLHDQHTALSWFTLVIGAIGVVIGGRRTVRLFTARR